MTVSIFYIRLWGALDIAYILWRVFSDILKSEVPFIDSFVRSYDAAINFDQIFIVLLTVFAAILSLSIAVSGWLMLVLKKSGVFISLFQLPFRLTLVIPPTFFFLQWMNGFFPSLVLITVILLMEVFKAVTQILWLRKRS